MGEKERQRERLAFLLNERSAVIGQRKMATSKKRAAQFMLNKANQEIERLSAIMSFINKRIEEVSALLEAGKDNEQ